MKRLKTDEEVDRNSPEEVNQNHTGYVSQNSKDQTASSVKMFVGVLS